MVEGGAFDWGLMMLLTCDPGLLDSPGQGSGVLEDLPGSRFPAAASQSDARWSQKLGRWCFPRKP